MISTDMEQEQSEKLRGRYLKVIEKFERNTDIGDYILITSELEYGCVDTLQRGRTDKRRWDSGKELELMPYGFTPENIQINTYKIY